MAVIPKHNSINEIMEKGDVPQKSRDYLGYSGLGHKCLRYQWYSFRWCYSRSIPHRINRIFRRGDIEENRVIEDLKKHGCEISNIQEEVVGVTGHVKGHTDGTAICVPTAEATPHLFECKTMKAKSYKEYLKVGLRRYSAPYWQQIHSYMGHLGLTRCLYVVVNKDTEERDYQRIKFDKSQFEDGERIALEIITADKPPQRMPGASERFFECAYCDARNQCYGKEPIRVTCRTCINCSFENEGKLSCSLHGALDKHAQLLACDKYEQEDYSE